MVETADLNIGLVVEDDRLAILPATVRASIGVVVGPMPTLPAADMVNTALFPSNAEVDVETANNG